ncbi:MAG: UDP-N-acetylglucosamine 2-epimerase (non-hydrolyzing) [bacterium]|nr:UDP-N-acetylglucosamine 2-epimerase (non-hydrolyzing) [bacterium]
MIERSHICFVVGARPNFVKVAPLLRAMRRYPAHACSLVHTGQHESEEMAGTFFRDLELPKPAYHLGVGDGSPAQRIARIIERFESVLLRERPALVVVVGDVDSTLAAALATVKIPGHLLAHVEAGLRSFNRRMPEEVNRVVVDHLSDILFITEESARANLLREGIDPARMHDVGNVMIDALSHMRARGVTSPVIARYGLSATPYAVVTIHRPENVDARATLQSLLQSIARVAEQITCVWPVHPRTSARLQEFGFMEEVEEMRRTARIVMVEPQCYPSMVALLQEARVVLTDSGGLQEEATALGIPCGTLREETERPITVTVGTNTIVGTSSDAIVRFVQETLRQPKCTTPKLPPLWDGHAAERMTRIMDHVLTHTVAHAHA